MCLWASVKPASSHYYNSQCCNSNQPWSMSQSIACCVLKVLEFVGRCGNPVCVCGIESDQLVTPPTPGVLFPLRPVCSSGRGKALSAATPAPPQTPTPSMRTTSAAQRRTAAKVHCTVLEPRPIHTMSLRTVVFFIIILFLLFFSFAVTYFLGHATNMNWNLCSLCIGVVVFSKSHITKRECREAVFYFIFSTGFESD